MRPLRIDRKEFVKRIAPLICVEGKKFQEMQANQTYSLLNDIGIILVDRRRLQQIIGMLVKPSKFMTDYGKGRLSLAKELLGQEVKVEAVDICLICGRALDEDGFCEIHGAPLR